MPTTLNVYLGFGDKTREAMEFYKSVFGGTLELHTFKEFNASPDPSEDNKIMHAMLVGDSGITFMAADSPQSMEYKPAAGFSMSLSGDKEAELMGYFEKLSAGGSITMPVEKQIWGDTFGMCLDKFGISWMINITAPKTSEA